MARKKPTSATNNILAKTSIAPYLLAILDGGSQNILDGRKSNT